MSITNTTKENLIDGHNKPLVVFVMLIFLVFFGGVCYAHLLSFLWWCLICSSFKFSLVVFAMPIF
jgi:cyanate permease